jgi:hypothetical protein
METSGFTHAHPGHVFLVPTHLLLSAMEVPPHQTKNGYYADLRISTHSVSGHGQEALTDSAEAYAKGLIKG